MKVKVRVRVSHQSQHDEREVTHTARKRSILPLPILLTLTLTLNEVVSEAMREKQARQEKDTSTSDPVGPGYPSTDLACPPFDCEF